MTDRCSDSGVATPYSEVNEEENEEKEGSGVEDDPVSPISDLSFTPSEGETTPYAAEIILDILDNLATSSNENSDNTKDDKQPRKKGPTGSTRGSEEDLTKGAKPTVESQSSAYRNKPTTQLSNSPSLNTSATNSSSAHYTSNPNDTGGVPNYGSQSSLGGTNYGHNSTVSSFSSPNGSQWNQVLFRPYPRHLSWTLEIMCEQLPHYAIGPLSPSIFPVDLPSFSRQGGGMYLVPRNVGNGYNEYTMAVVGPFGEVYSLAFKN